MEERLHELEEAEKSGLTEKNIEININYTEIRNNQKMNVQVNNVARAYLPPKRGGGASAKLESTTSSVTWEISPRKRPFSKVQAAGQQPLLKYDFSAFKMIPILHPPIGQNSL